MKRGDIFEAVCECIQSSLDISVLGGKPILPEHRLVADLGADSLDLLDLTFHLEQRFGVRVSPREMERRVREKLGGGPIEIDGIYTPEAVAEFRLAMPEVPQMELEDGLTTAGLLTALRVVSMVNLVALLLEEKRV